MPRTRRLLACGALLCGAAPAAALAASPHAPARAARPVPRALRLSHDLWATIDVCDTPHQPHRVGIRGSMPGDGQAHDAIVMRFRLQYLSDSLSTWIDLPSAASNFITVGSAKSTRQSGRTFTLAPPGGGHSYTMRGVVTFQWRRGSTLLASISRPTTSGHTSLAGAEPAGFSAATCEIR
jgi:hypothetical protein